VLDGKHFNRVSKSYSIKASSEEDFGGSVFADSSITNETNELCIHNGFTSSVMQPVMLPDWLRINLAGEYKSLRSGNCILTADGTMYATPACASGSPDTDMIRDSITGIPLTDPASNVLALHRAMSPLGGMTTPAHTISCGVKLTSLIE
jgi:hypothetical protein